MVSIAIQAGGRSSRMGRDKALMRLAGKRLIEYVLDRVQGLSDDLFITTNNPASLADLDVRLVQDEIPGQGALFGLRTALLAAQHDMLLTVACDMPFVAPGLIEYILSLAGRADVIIPRVDGTYEPMLAMYRSSTCLPAIERSLTGEDQRMISFFSSLDVLAIGVEEIERVDPQRLSFFNINTPADMKRAEAILSKSAAQISTPDAVRTHNQTKTDRTETHNAD